MDQLLAEGLQLMGVGMGVVFLFLGMLVGVINLVSIVIRKSGGDSIHAGAEGLGEDTLQTVLSEAVKRYRSGHKS